MRGDWGIEAPVPSLVGKLLVSYCFRLKTCSKEEYKAVDYNGLTSVLIEAVKELMKAHNEKLRSRIEALEGA